MDSEEFRKWSRRAADWGADYRATLADRPVQAQTPPGAVARQIAAAPPEAPEAMDAIFADFEEVVLPGMTHWQHPRFFAYFPANAAPASVIAEYLVSSMAAQCMLWQTSPAATELETRVLDWLRQAVGLPEGYAGVIQDSASGATLAAVLTMRERALDWQGNRSGLSGKPAIRIYTSREAHSSVMRAAWIAGIGEENLVMMPGAGPMAAMDAKALEAAIAADRAAGLLPAGIVASVGATGIGAVDELAALGAVARRCGLYLHVDAAWAGSAMICPEFRHLWSGIEAADSIVFNPHKWLGAQFDCSAHFIREPAALVRTLAIRPDYLRPSREEGDPVINYSEWSVPLGRRFRALKLWFLLRAHGLADLRAMIRRHVAWSEALAARLAATDGFEVVTPPVLSLFTFRALAPDGGHDALNRALVTRINDEGRIYLTQTTVAGQFVIRFQVGAFATTEADMDVAYETIVGLAAECRAGHRA